MNILHHLTILPPKMPEAEALSQEISALCSDIGGELMYLNPNQRSPLPVPRLLFGFHRLKEIQAREKDIQLHTLYNPDPFPFPVLRRLRRPVIYVITAGLRSKRPNVRFFSRLAAVAVADERSLQQLKAWGITNAVLIQPGIDTNRFSYTPCPLDSEIRLMVGSAPWTKAQFESKGVQALLESAQQMPRLKLVFLWRGVLADEMDRRAAQMNLGSRVTILNKQVDVNQILGNVHAAITLAATPDIVKSYPHSLLDSLAAGKPVLISRAIPMADYVAKTGCGAVVARVTPGDILASLETLTNNYESAQKTALQVGRQDFGLETMLASYKNLYQTVLG